MTLFNELIPSDFLDAPAHRYWSKTTQYNHELLNIQITGHEAAYAWIQKGLGAQQSSYILSQSEFKKLIAAEVTLDDLGDQVYAYGPMIQDIAKALHPDDHPQNANQTLQNPAEEIEEENSLQTEQEAFFSIDPAMQDGIRSVFGRKDPCSKFSQDALTDHRVSKLKTKDGIEVERPSFSCLYSCFSTGELLPAQTQQFLYNDLLFGKTGGKVIISQFRARVESEKELFIQRIMESSKIGVGLGLNLSGAAGGSMMVLEGAAAFSKGKPKTDPASGKQISLNLSMVKQHYEMTIKAQMRFMALHEPSGDPVVIDF